MDNCCTLYFLSTLSCQLAGCLSENELAALSADLSTLGSMLATILAHRALCQPGETAELPVTSGTTKTSENPTASGKANSPWTPETARQITIV